MKYLVTGAAGFIGANVSKRLCAMGHEVVGIDNLNDYYDVGLKLARLAPLEALSNFRFIKQDLADREGIATLFAQQGFQRVIHLAAQAGVRYSLDNPLAYADSNLVGHLTILEGCRHHKIEHLVYASSSSVYGLNQKMPFSTEDSVDHPISLYAATKKANELMSHTYSHLYQLPTTGLRFFTVYGPWGRPDMALFKFTKAILASETIDVYNHGDLSRDFTYIDDIVEGIIRVQDKPPSSTPDWHIETGTPANSSAPYRVFNIGNGSPVQLLDFITALERALGIEAKKQFLPMQPGDVHSTWADTEDLFKAVGYKPQVDINTGVSRFVEWYRAFYAK
ncbi:NAD-dependent epimerase [Shewanella xiamenensis]|uniref:NAD-dependent epimerase n=1 Tax=Shewanella xiamenensis TaxID=332186 RepID=A0AAW6R0X1_9GAMM|nr:MULTISPECIES: NAD-dependent epimerase [Shewanella]MCH7421689.1 NAD-dependent epimerase [Shewanella sp. MM_2022_3]MDG5901480.1 NAD-dependent epimerase [Shewanella xiamenensis]MDI5834054.1 NAD-dependent epimerase [Shewanella xiamenensis]NSM25774.1 NAD-dependent epimerase [Shewanella sp. ZOR0012]